MNDALLRCRIELVLSCLINVLLSCVLLWPRSKVVVTGAGQYVHVECPKPFKAIATWRSFRDAEDSAQLAEYVNDGVATGYCYLDFKALLNLKGTK